MKKEILEKSWIKNRIWKQYRYEENPEQKGEHGKQIYEKRTNLRKTLIQNKQTKKKKKWQKDA